LNFDLIHISFSLKEEPIPTHAHLNNE